MQNLFQQGIHFLQCFSDLVEGISDSPVSNGSFTPYNRVQTMEI